MRPIACSAALLENEALGPYVFIKRRTPGILKARPPSRNGPVALVVNRHLDERRGRMVKPDVQVELAERLPRRDASLAFLGELPQCRATSRSGSIHEPQVRIIWVTRLGFLIEQEPNQP